jgi:hypothetical protein
MAKPENESPDRAHKGHTGPGNIASPVPASTRFRTSRLAATGAVAITAATTACSVGALQSGELDELQRIHATCQAKPPAAMVRIDGTDSSNSDAITAERLNAVESITRETAVCGGRLRVAVFSSSSAGTVTLYDGVLRPPGATTNARLRRVPKLVDKAMSQIRSGDASAVAKLPGGGSDIIAQYRLAGEWISQLGGGYRLRFVLLTDGFQTTGVNFYRQALTKQAAIALADRTTVPKLPGASVTVAGLGRVAGSPPSSATVNGLATYYDALCARTGAAACTSVIDYAVGR